MLPVIKLIIILAINEVQCRVDVFYKLFLKIILQQEREKRGEKWCSILIVKDNQQGPKNREHQ